jgi:hypothetical protein
MECSVLEKLANERIYRQKELLMFVPNLQYLPPIISDMNLLGAVVAINTGYLVAKISYEIKDTLSKKP